MVLKLTVYIRNGISFSYKPTIGLNSDIWNILGTNFRFWSMLYTYSLLTIGYFEVSLALWHHCDIIHWMFVPILVCMERKDPLSYTMVPIRHFSKSQGMVTTHRYGKLCYIKMVGKMRVKACRKKNNWELLPFTFLLLFVGVCVGGVCVGCVCGCLFVFVLFCFSVIPGFVTMYLLFSYNFMLSRSLACSL